jgi:hypothetical protein
MSFVRAFWWLTFIVSLAILFGSLPGYWAHVNRSDLVSHLVTVQRVALVLGALLSILSAVLSIALAVLLFFKKQTDRMALFLSFYLLGYGILMVGPLEHFLPFWFPASGNLALILQSALFALPTIVLILIFPNGIFAPRWTRWLVVPAGALMLLAFFVIRNPDEIVRGNTITAVSIYVAIGVLLVVAFGVQFYRYFRFYSPLERQQAKWVVYGFVVSYVALMLVSIPYYYLQNLPPGTPFPWWAALGGLGWWLGLMIQPLAFTFAILRARLWDIDVIVRRTVLYAVVTFLLALIYFGSVISLQQIFARLAVGQPNELVTALSTLAIAALFVPLRNKIQAAIDQRFNRKKYDAQKVMEKFSQTVRDETDIDKLTNELVNVVNETMQPKSVSVWLGPSARSKRGAMDETR